MRKRIYRNFCFIALIALLFSTAASLFLYLRFYQQENRNNLQRSCQYLADGAASVEEMGGDPLHFLKDTVSGEEVRLTLISSEGQVVWDSQVDASKMDNHNQRPEFLEAITGKMGEENRLSDTLGKSTYYCALAFGDENMVLRLGQDTQNILGVFLHILPLDLFSCLLLFCVCILLSNGVTGHILHPLLNAADHLDQLEDQELYEELTPFIHTIRQQNDTIRQQLNSILEDQGTIALILENMQEGLVLLTEEKRILSVNRSALRMLGCSVESPSGQNFLVLTRDGSLVQAVDNALSGSPVSGLLPETENGEIFQYFVNPVSAPSGDASGGVILLLLDVTQQQLAQRSREEFSANVSHELKTPLTSISGFAELMEAGMASSPEDVKNFSGLIHKEARRLLSLIDDIIRLSHIEDGRGDAMEPVELYALAKEELEHLQPAAEQKQVTLSMDGSPAYVEGNPTMLRELVYNLCENAVKYNVTGGSVHLTVSHEGTGVKLTVADTGIGIPAQHQERVFERFYRVDKSRSKETGGTGLGLSIVKHVVQRHGGQLSLHSTPGEGTEITILFPGLTD